MCKVVGKNIKEIRLSKGLSQKRLSECIGVSQSSIDYWERGKRTPSIEACIKLADYFGVSIDSLVRGSNSSGCLVSRLSGYKDHMKKCSEKCEMVLASDVVNMLDELENDYISLVRKIEGLGNIKFSSFSKPLIAVEDVSLILKS